MTLAELEAALTLDLQALAKKSVAENRSPENIRKNALGACALIEKYLHASERVALEMIKNAIAAAGGTL